MLNKIKGLNPSTKNDTEVQNFAPEPPPTPPRNISMCAEVGCRDENGASKCARGKRENLQLSLEGVGIVIKKKKKKTNIRHPTSELFSHRISSQKKTDQPCAGTHDNIG